MNNGQNGRGRRERLPVDVKEFGRRLREARIERGMGIGELAFEMSKIWQQNHPGKIISATWISDCERGRGQSLDRERVAVAALALGVRVTRLLPPLPESETPTETDMIVALRAYGLSDHDVDEILDAVESLRSRTSDSDHNHKDS